jgi:NAD(P)H dehydrogenase (quinone)
MIHVTGASGALASLVVPRLGTADVVTSSRTPGGTSPRGATRAADFDDPASLSRAFAGADVLLLISAGQNEDDTVIARHRAAIDAAEAVGVGHIVYTSLTGAADHTGLALSHRWTERRLQDGRADWTILRNGLYVELVVPFVAQAAATGVLTAPFGFGSWAAVAREDLAEVTARVLLDPDAHRGRTYELGGSSTVTGHDLALVAGEAAGRRVTYAPFGLGMLRQALGDLGMPAWQVPSVVSTFSSIQAGFLDATSSDLPDLLGREPSPVLEVLRDALNTGL